MFRILRNLFGRKPVVVTVYKTRWMVVDEPTTRNQYLTRMLEIQGGINHTVAPGQYHYNVVLTPRGYVQTLEPIS